MDGVVDLPVLDAGPWIIDQRLDPLGVRAFRTWLMDPVIAASVGRPPTAYSDADVAAIHASHDRRTGWMAFVRPRNAGDPVAYVSLRVSPVNGVARLDMLVGDPRVRALQVQDEVTRALGAWTFRDQHVRKVVFDVRADNHATVRWLKRIATLEGRLRGEMVLADGTVLDNLRFGIMADEWEALVGSLATSTSAEARARPRTAERVARLSR